MQEYIEMHGRNSKHRSLLTKLLAGDPATNTPPLTDPEVSTEVSNLLFAATDTTGATLSYALYELCCRGEWQTALRRELREMVKQETGRDAITGLPIPGASPIKPKL